MPSIRNFRFDLPAAQQFISVIPDRFNIQPLSHVLDCMAFSRVTGKFQGPHLGLLVPIAQTLSLLQSRLAPKSVSVYGSPILVVKEVVQAND